MRDDSGAATADIDFARVFETLPSPYMILDEQLNFVEANAAYCKVTGRSRERLIGRNLFDLFPNTGPEGQRLRDSLKRVLATGKPDALPLIRYPIPRPDGKGMETRFWSAAHTPVFDRHGRAAYVLQNTVDVTELQRLKQIAYGPDVELEPGEKDLLQRTLAVEQENRALLEETQGLRDLFMQAPGFMAVLTGPDMTFALVNNAYLQLIGHRQVIGKPLDEALPEIRGQGFLELMNQVVETKTPFVGTASSVRLQRTPEGPLEERFVDFIYQPILRANGEVSGVFVEGSDVTDRVTAERQQRLLVDELNHRVKNTLATVQAIAAQTLKGAADPNDFRQAFESRLMAMSATHDLLTATNWRGAELRDVLMREFKPYANTQYSLEGQDVSLAPSQAMALGLVLHELATNAAKYGALSSPEGCVSVTWRTEEDRLLLTWEESKGPQVSPPLRRGFGSRLIERSLGGSLHGEAELQFLPPGLKCLVSLPLRAD